MMPDDHDRVAAWEARHESLRTELIAAGYGSTYVDAMRIAFMAGYDTATTREKGAIKALWKIAASPANAWMLRNMARMAIAKLTDGKG